MIICEIPLMNKKQRQNSNPTHLTEFSGSEHGSLICFFVDHKHKKVLFGL